MRNPFASVVVLLALALCAGIAAAQDKQEQAKPEAVVPVEPASLAPEGVQKIKRDADGAPKLLPESGWKPAPPPEALPMPAEGSSPSRREDAILIAVPVIPQKEKVPEKVFDLNLELLSMFQWRNDADFDRTEPYYNAYGQEVGILGTFLKPMFSIRMEDALRFYWEAEIGLDLWSRNNPDVGLSDPDTKQGQSLALGLKQREIYGEAHGYGLGAKAGFQRVIDPSTLFVNCWIGAARFSWDRGDRYGLTLTVGEFPEQTFKGWDFASSSFRTDMMLYALDLRARFIEHLRVFGGAYFVDDQTLVGHRRQVTALEGKVLWEGRDWHASASGISMLGYRQGMGADGSNNDIKAWGAFGEGAWRYRWFSGEAVLTFMSGDDRYEGNDSGAFLYSGRRGGPTTFLTENDLRPLGDNLDKLVGSADGVFYEMRAGLAGFDLGLYVHPRPWLKAGPVFGVLYVLNGKNALDSTLVAAESQLYAEATFFNGAFSVVGQGGALFPGGAGAAYLNAIGRYATDSVYFIQTGLVWRL